MCILAVLGLLLGQHYEMHPTRTYKLQVDIYCNYEHCRTQHK